MCKIFVFIDIQKENLDNFFSENGFSENQYAIFDLNTLGVDFFKKNMGNQPFNPVKILWENLTIFIQKIPTKNQKIALLIDDKFPMDLFYKKILKNNQQNNIKKKTGFENIMIEKVYMNKVNFECFFAENQSPTFPTEYTQQYHKHSNWLNISPENIEEMYGMRKKIVAFINEKNIRYDFI